jgi:hypothetical protein
LISQYDQEIDQGVTAFQKKMDLFLIQKQRNPAQPINQDLYDGVQVDLTVLHTRAASVPKNVETTRMIENVIAQVDTVEAHDRAGKSGSVFYQFAQSTIDQDCGNILKLELAKKRGE